MIRDRERWTREIACGQPNMTKGDELFINYLILKEDVIILFIWVSGDHSHFYLPFIIII